ncbi:unnamed protein product [Porites lobata]|uniref:F-box domain-containing protein n=1 Tax=Porites lobata TaxID=104759 RepID=A0ABN8P8L8_9CNID|nr:unnamed protein product [Porites lobata]
MPKEKQSSLNSFFSKKTVSKLNYHVVTLSENPSTSSASSSSPEEILEPPAKSPTITSAGLKDLPSEILVQIFQYLTIQDCLRGVGRVCRRFQGLIEYTGEVWRTLETDVELSTEAFQNPRDDNCGEANPVSDVPYDVSHVVKSAEKLSDAERVQFLENCWRPTPSCSNLDTQYWKSGNLNKHIKFQIKWLDQRKWLAYSARPDHIGAWCITCCLF